MVWQLRQLSWKYYPLKVFIKKIIFFTAFFSLRHACKIISLTQHIGDYIQNYYYKDVKSIQTHIEYTPMFVFDGRSIKRDGW